MRVSWGRGEGGEGVTKNSMNRSRQSRKSAAVQSEAQERCHTRPTQRQQVPSAARKGVLDTGAFTFTSQFLYANGFSLACFSMLIIHGRRAYHASTWDTPPVPGVPYARGESHLPPSTTAPPRSMPPVQTRLQSKLWVLGVFHGFATDPFASTAAANASTWGADECIRRDSPAR
jgi:hypothetical protein